VHTSAPRKQRKDPKDFSEDFRDIKTFNELKLGWRLLRRGRGTFLVIVAWNAGFMGGEGIAEQWQVGEDNELPLAFPDASHLVSRV
jgi:hypothetical protein